MLEYLFVFLAWIVFLVVAFPYVQKIKHEDQKLGAAYLIFVTVFSVGAYVLFSVIISVLGIVWDYGQVTGPAIAVAVFIGSVIPSAWLATVLASKPPRNSPMQQEKR